MATPSHPEIDHSVPTATLPKVDFIDYLLFPLFVLSFFAIIIFVDPIIRICNKISRPVYFWSNWLLSWLIVNSTKIIGVKIIVERLSEIDPHTQYIIAANHQSFLDIPFLRILYRERNPRFVAKLELSRFIPSISVDLRVGEHALVDRSNARQAIKALEKFCARLRETKNYAVIFPEGTRARDGRLKKFHGAGFLKLLSELPDAPVLPITIDGSWVIGARKFGPIPRGITVRVVVGKPIVRSPEKSSQDILKETYETIKMTMTNLRSQAEMVARN